MTREEFMNHEVMVWGEDEVFAFLDEGFVPTVVNGKWTWVKETVDATNLQSPAKGLTLVAA
jgi:hypothetical protein